MLAFTDDGLKPLHLYGVFLRESLHLHVKAQMQIESAILYIGTERKLKQLTPMGSNSFWK